MTLTSTLAGAMSAYRHLTHEKLECMNLAYGLRRLMFHAARIGLRPFEVIDPRLYMRM